MTAKQGDGKENLRGVASSSEGGVINIEFGNRRGRAHGINLNTDNNTDENTIEGLRRANLSLLRRVEALEKAGSSYHKELMADLVDTKLELADARKTIENLEKEVLRLEQPLSGVDKAIDIKDEFRRVIGYQDAPDEVIPAIASEIKKVVARFKLAAAQRPLWLDRKLYPRLKNLSAPDFLKQVWADQIASDGAIDRSVIAQKDKDLLKVVGTYIGKRQNRGQDLGDAAGLRLIRSKVGRPKKLQGG